MSSPIISLIDVAKYFNNLDHQIAALNWLQSQIPAATMAQFAEMWRQTPKPEPETSKPNPQPITPVYQLKFSMALRRSSSLLEGKLEFLLNGVAYNTMRCTSSLPGRQVAGGWNKRGGLIPPTSMVKAKCGVNYTVKTAPIYMPNVIGVSGNFYPIAPFEFQTDGDNRGDWGIHNDANAPGSMGCIVALLEDGWTAIQREFKKLEGIGVRSIELIVEYS